MLHRWIGDQLCPSEFGASQPDIVDGFEHVHRMYREVETLLREPLLRLKDKTSRRDPVLPDDKISAEMAFFDARVPEGLNRGF